MVKKIGFCFLVYDIINQAEAWRTFFEGVDPNKYQIYIHFKENKPLDHFEKYKLDNCIPTQYASLSIIHAHNLLFQAALKDHCYKIVSLSQSCIPLKSFDYVYEFLTKDSYAHFNICSQDQCFPRCNSLLKHYPAWQIQKSSNWFILNQITANLVVDYSKEKINQEYEGIYCPEEHYFISRIYQTRLWEELTIHRGSPEQATTFTNWAGTNYRYPVENGLKNYKNISQEELEYLLSAPCLFGRKFDAECSLAQGRYFEFIKSTKTS